MRVPHLFDASIHKGGTAAKQFITAYCKRILVGITARIALPLFGRHIGCCPSCFAEGSVCLHAQVKRCAKIRKEELSTAPDEQITWLDILVNQPILMHKA